MYKQVYNKLYNSISYTAFIYIFPSIIKKNNKMGCAFPLQNSSPVVTIPHRTGKRTQRLDCRKKSTQTMDTIIQNVIKVSQGNITQNQKSVQLAKQVLQNHCLFSTLQEKQIEQVVKNMFSCTTKQNEYVFMQNDPAVCFFIIEEGEVDVEVDDKYVKTLTRGQAFGEIALIYLGKRAASIKSKSASLKLIGLKSIEFKKVLQNIRIKYQQITKKILQKVHIFSLLTTKQKISLVNSLTQEKHKKDEVLFAKNDRAYKFYIIQSGKVSLTFDNPNKKDTILGRLQTFGESTFRNDGFREGTAVVQQDTVCLTINKQKMNQILGRSLYQIIFQNIKKWALKSSPAFDGLDNNQLDQLVSKFQTRHARVSDIIIDEGQKIQSVIIGVQGQINQTNPGTLFFDKEFSKWSQNFTYKKAKKQLIKTSDGVYATIKFSKLAEQIQAIRKKTQAKKQSKQRSSFKNRVRDSILSSRKILGSLQNIQEQDNIKQQYQIDFNSLEYIKQLGSGQFGLVYLVKDKKSGILFAMKSLDKEAIKQQKMQESTVAQREILSFICHPLIVGYYNAYEDSRNIYFFLQFINGIEMFDAIRQMVNMNKAMVRYYMGSLVLALQYLHSKDVIYRDIKPENSIINYQGKVFLIDMGTSKVLTAQENYRTSTIIGTPHYMAPEVMAGKGYSFQADYWSLGVILYQFVCGNLPFGQMLEDPWDIYASVLRFDVQFKSHVVDKKLKQLIRKLLNKNVAYRSKGKFQSIKDSQYFQGFQWSDLAQGIMCPPYIPKKFRQGKNRKFEQIQGYPLLDFLATKQQKSKPKKSNCDGIKQNELQNDNNKPVFREWTSDTVE